MPLEKTNSLKNLKKKDVDVIDKQMRNNLKDQFNYVKHLDPMYRKALNHYTGHGFRVNQDVRQANIVGRHNKVFYNNLTDALKRAPPLKEDLIVYRGINYKKPPSNSTLDDFAFTSATYNPMVALSFMNLCCLFRITVKAGTTILPLVDISNYPHECEILLPPGQFVLHETKLNESNKFRMVDQVVVIDCTFVEESKVDYKYNVKKWHAKVAKSLDIQLLTNTDSVLVQKIVERSEVYQQVPTIYKRSVLRHLLKQLQQHQETMDFKMNKLSIK